MIARILRRLRVRRVVTQNGANERADVIAYLARRRDNAQRVAGNSSPSPATREEARVIVRQMELLMQDLRTGLHVGEREMG